MPRQTGPRELEERLAYVLARADSPECAARQLGALLVLLPLNHAGIKRRVLRWRPEWRETVSNLGGVGIAEIHAIRAEFREGMRTKVR